MINKKVDFVIKTPFVDKLIKSSVHNICSFRKRSVNKQTRRVVLKKLKIRNLIINRRTSHNGYTQAET
jgi:hypothetical protein